MHYKLGGHGSRERTIRDLRWPDLAPNLYARIPGRIRSSRTVLQALDVGPDIDEPILREFLGLWASSVAFSASTDNARHYQMGTGGEWLLLSGVRAKF